MDVDPRRRFELTDKVGKGAFAAVYRGKDRETGRSVAIKKVHLQSGKGRIEDFQVVCWQAGAETLIRRQNEVAALKQARNPHIVELIGAWLTGKQVSSARWCL